MNTTGLRDVGNYLAVEVEGVAKIDVSKLNYDILQRDSFSKSSPYYRWVLFLEIENHSTRPWEWGANEWELQDTEGSHYPSTDLHYPLSKLPKGWEAIQVKIPPNESVNVVLVYSGLSDESEWRIHYRKMLAEGWYTSIKSDDDVHISDFTKEYEDIEIVIDPETRESLRYENYNE